MASYRLMLARESNFLVDAANTECSYLGGLTLTGVPDGWFYKIMCIPPHGPRTYTPYRHVPANGVVIAGDGNVHIEWHTSIILGDIP